MDIDIATGQREGVDIRAIHHSELVIEIAAVTGARHALTDALDVSTQGLVFHQAVLFEYLLVIALAEADFVALAHHHKIGFTGGRVDRASGEQTQQQQRQYAAHTRHHGHSLNMLGCCKSTNQRARPLAATSR